MKDRFKFRVFDKNNKELTELTGFAIPDFVKEGDEELNFVGLQGGFGGQIKGKFKDFVLMQSTGLKDKNGKLIFEGDLFHYTCSSDNLKRLVKIIYCPDKMGFEVVQVFEGQEEVLWAFVDGWETYETPKYLRTIDIIGNIHENPELLNKTED